MMKYSFRILAVRLFLTLLFLCLVLAGRSQSAAILSGTVNNYLTGAPILGAKISFDNNYTYSLLGGGYILNITSSGTFPVVCSKPGYDAYFSNPRTFQPAFTYSMNLAILESSNPPTSVTAHLDTTGSVPVVPVQWQVPAGRYDLIYDDGIQDNFTVWATQGNQNALRITPLGYPARVTGGMINIGNAANYPAGSIPFVPFQVSAYDAGGPDGLPRFSHRRARCGDTFCLRLARIFPACSRNSQQREFLFCDDPGGKCTKCFGTGD